LTRPLRKSSLSNNQEFFPLFEKMEIDPCRILMLPGVTAF
jgi:hypothetical protein